jgi:F-type H+-transporting ATPase subunit delta
VAGAIDTDPSIHAVMMSPRVTKAAKAKVLGSAFRGFAAESFVRFLAAVVQRGRQGILPAISAAYQNAMDVHFNRVHAGVVTARPLDQKLRGQVEKRLTEAVGKTVLPHFQEDARIIGGLIVRVGDRVFDGSIRRRIQKLRYRMMGG